MSLLKGTGSHMHLFKECWVFNFQSIWCKIRSVCSERNINLSGMQPFLDLFSCKMDETDTQITFIWRDEFKSKMWLITRLWHRWGVMKPWPSCVLFYYIPACLLVTGVLIHSFSHHTPRICQQFTVEFNSGSELMILGLTGKGCFLPRWRCARVETCPRGESLHRRTAPIIFPGAQSRPCYSLTFPASSTAAQPGIWTSRIQWLPAVTQLGNKWWRWASCWVVASRLSAGTIVEEQSESASLQWVLGNSVTSVWDADGRSKMQTTGSTERINSKM